MFLRVVLTVLRMLGLKRILEVPMPSAIRLGWAVLTTVVDIVGPRRIYVSVSRVTARLRLVVTGLSVVIVARTLLSTSCPTNADFRGLAVCEFLGGVRLGPHPLASIFRVSGDYMTRLTLSPLYAGTILDLTIWQSTSHRGRPETTWLNFTRSVTLMVVLTLLLCYLEILMHTIPLVCIRLLKVCRALLKGALQLK